MSVIEREGDAVTISNGLKWAIGIFLIVVFAIGGPALTYMIGRLDRADLNIDTNEDALGKHYADPWHTAAGLRMEQLEKTTGGAIKGVKEDVKEVKENVATIAKEQRDSNLHTREFEIEQRSVNREVLQTLDTIKKNGSSD